MLYRRVELPSDEPVAYVGVYVLRWGKVEEPSVAFVEASEEDIQAALSRFVVSKEEIRAESSKVITRWQAEGGIAMVPVSLLEAIHALQLRKMDVVSKEEIEAAVDNLCIVGMPQGIHNELVNTVHALQLSKVDRGVADLLREFVDAMHQYQMDVDDFEAGIGPTQKHRDMMRRADVILAGMGGQQ